MIALSFLYENPLIAIPLAKLISDYNATEVTALQNVQENLHVGTQYRQVTRANNPLGGY